MMARWGTHGDHPVIALCPSSVKETFDLTVRLDVHNIQFYGIVNVLACRSGEDIVIQNVECSFDFIFKA